MYKSSYFSYSTVNYVSFYVQILYISMCTDTKKYAYMYVYIYIYMYTPKYIYIYGVDIYIYMYLKIQLSYIYIYVVHAWCIYATVLCLYLTLSLPASRCPKPRLSKNSRLPLASQILQSWGCLVSYSFLRKRMYIRYHIMQYIYI